MTRPHRARTTAASNRGSFAPRTRAEANGVDLAPAVLPPDPGPGLVKPVTCRKCRGDGTYTYASGVPGVCAPCSGSGQVEGDKGARDARRIRQEAAAALHRLASDHSVRATHGFQRLREQEPERFEKALASMLAGRDDVAQALHDYDLEAEKARNPRLRVMEEIKAWEPPFDGLDTCDGAFDRCKYVSAAFTRDMRARGYHVEWVQMAGMVGECPDAHPAMADIAPEHWHHYVTRIRVPGPLDGHGQPTAEQDHYVDWTMRQFWPNSTYPFIDSAALYERRWLEVHPIEQGGHDVLDRYLATTGHGPRQSSGSPRRTP